MSQTIEDLLAARIADIDIEEEVLEVIREHIKGDVYKGIKNALDNYLQAMIAVEVEKVMSGPITISDGYNPREEYRTFEEFFRVSLQKTMKDNWKIQNIVHQYTEKRIQEIIKEREKEVVKKIVDELTAGVK